MVFDAKGSDFLEGEFLPPQDFTEDLRREWHCELSVMPNSRFTLRVKSESGIGGEWHTVSHDYDDIIDCSDNEHPWCKHCRRAYLVLSLRKLRRQKEPLQAPVETPQEPTLGDKIDRAPLTKSNGFSIL